MKNKNIQKLSSSRRPNLKQLKAEIFQQNLENVRSQIARRTKPTKSFQFPSRLEIKLGDWNPAFDAPLPWPRQRESNKEVRKALDCWRIKFTYQKLVQTFQTSYPFWRKRKRET